jgi:hypothetical protein
MPVLAIVADPAVGIRVLTVVINIAVIGGVLGSTIAVVVVMNRLVTGKTRFSQARLSHSKRLIFLER